MVPTKEETLQHEKIQSYRTGWRDRASSTYNPKRFEHRPDLKEFYERGSSDCSLALTSAIKGICKDIGMPYETLMNMVMR